jgi:hypothetical protein
MDGRVRGVVGAGFFVPRGGLELLRQALPAWRGDGCVGVGVSGLLGQVDERRLGKLPQWNAGRGESFRAGSETSVAIVYVVAILPTSRTARDQSAVGIGAQSITLHAQISKSVGSSQTSS